MIALGDISPVVIGVYCALIGLCLMIGNLNVQELLGRGK